MLRKIAKWTLRGFLSIIILVVLAYLFVYFHTEGRINTSYQFEDEIVEVPTDSIAISKGAHLYQIRGCEDCHGKRLQGSIFMDDPILMRVTAPNLTKGKEGLGKDYLVTDWVRAIRHGVDKNGHSLFMMPSHELYQLTNEDLSNIIAYCQSREPVDIAPDKLHTIGPIGRVLMAMDNVTVLPAEKIDHKSKRLAKTLKQEGVEYGKYLAISCQGCHRPDMRGGSPLAPGFPPVPDITANGNLGHWDEASFIKTLKTGNTPEEKSLDNQYMPWQSISHFTDEELKSIYEYLKSL